MIPFCDLELLGDWGRLSRVDKLLWAVCAAVVISGEGPEDTFLHSALVSGKREDFSGVSEDRWLILAV